MTKFKPGDHVKIKSLPELQSKWKTDSCNWILTPKCSILPGMQQYCDTEDIVLLIDPQSTCPMLKENGYYWSPDALDLISDDDNNDNWNEIFSI